MSLPLLTSQIGAMLSKDSRSEFAAITKDIKKIKKDEVPYIVYLIFDIPKDEIYIELAGKYTMDSKEQYSYFGNNSRASAQYYLTRSLDFNKYLLLSTISDLYNTLKKNNMNESNLYNIIKDLSKQNMINLSEKKGGGSLNINKLSIVKNKDIGKIEIFDKGKIKIDDNATNPDSFIRLFIKDVNKKNKFVLVVPKVITKDNEKMILSKHKDYLDLVKKEKDLGEEVTKKRKGKERVCYICKTKKADVNSSYMTNFCDAGINKIFQTTKKNYSQILKDFDYDNNYSICIDCYQKLALGEKIVSEQFRGRIAGEDAFIIPQSLLNKLDYKHLNYLKEAADLAFKTNDAKNWISNIESELMDRENYAINFIVFKSDGKSVSIMEIIEDVPTIRLLRIMDVLAANSDSFSALNTKLSLGTIYRIIPVKTNKTKEQIDIGRILSFYKAILSGEIINHKILFEYVCEALDKGLKELNKSEIKNYFNMNLIYYANGREDFFIRKIVSSYLILIKACQDLKLLDKEILKIKDKEGCKMEMPTETSNKTDIFIYDAENFLIEHCFDNAAKALFYLGTLINRVAWAQFQKEHRTKPILKKIQFQGMTKEEIYRLYNDVIEKLRQYNKMTYFTESIMKKFHDYFGSLNEGDIMKNQHSNVFYLMAGYSYMVGTKAPDATKDENKAVEELIADEENEKYRKDEENDN